MKNYVPTTLDQYINESKSITLKRGYRGQNPVVVGANAPIRNQILSYVAESQKVGSTDLKKFIAGLNETNANPNAAANMWLRRNGKYFIAESKGGRTSFKLSKLGQRLVNSFGTSAQISEASGKKSYIALDKITASELKEFLADAKGPITFGGGDRAKPDVLAIAKKHGYKGKLEEKKKYDFKDPKTDEPGIVDGEDEEAGEGCSKTDESVEPGKKAKPNLGGKLNTKLHNMLSANQDKNDNELDGFDKEITEGEKSKGISSERKARIEAIIENIKSRQANPVNEGEEEKEEDKEESGEESAGDELSFDDLDLTGEEGDETAEGEEAETEGDEEDSDDTEGDDADVDAEDLEGDDDDGVEVDDKVEITEFILTVDDVDSAIAELDELGVDAEKVIDADAEVSVEEGEDGEDGVAYKEDEISVDAEDWDKLKGWLEDKGVDVEDMFGGEIEVEDVEDDIEDIDIDGEEGEEGEVDLEDLDLDDLDTEEGEEGAVELGDEAGADELELDAPEEPEVEESLTGMENHVNDTNNLIKGAKTVIIKYDK